MNFEMEVKRATIIQPAACVERASTALLTTSFLLVGGSAEPIWVHATADWQCHDAQLLPLTREASERATPPARSDIMAPRVSQLDDPLAEQRLAEWVPMRVAVPRDRHAQPHAWPGCIRASRGPGDSFGAPTATLPCPSSTLDARLEPDETRNVR